MVRIWTAAPLLALALAVSACDRDDGHGDDRQTRTLSVTGEGFVMAKPDLATISVGVTTDGETANLALAENNTRMAQVLKAVGAQGIPESDVQTSDLSIYPRYASVDPALPNAPQKIVGYSVNNSVTLTVRDLAKLGGALDQFVSAAGANTLSGLNFGFADPTALTDDARRKAVSDARRKAELYASAAGAKLGAIREVAEEGAAPPMPYQTMMYRAKEAGSVPVAAGELKLQASVRVVYELD